MDVFRQIQTLFQSLNSKSSSTIPIAAFVRGYEEYLKAKSRNSTSKNKKRTKSKKSSEKNSGLWSPKMKVNAQLEHERICKVGLKIKNKIKNKKADLNSFRRPFDVK